jgi:hypothetical protein
MKAQAGGYGFCADSFALLSGGGRICMPILDTIATKGTAIKQWFFSGKNQVRVPAIPDDAEGGWSDLDT